MRYVVCQLEDPLLPLVCNCSTEPLYPTSKRAAKDRGVLLSAYALEGHKSLDISDFYTRSRPSQQGDVTSKMLEIVMR
jgi:hypothetical protein